MRTTLALAALLLAGCYQSHELGGDGGASDLGALDLGHADAGADAFVDPCACELHGGSASSCGALPGCTWFPGDGCGMAPSGSVASPVCEAAHGTCSTNADCAPGDTCVSYWVNPCRVAACEACGGEDRRCVTLCFRPD